MSNLAPLGDDFIQTVAEIGLVQKVLNGSRNSGSEHEPENSVQILAALTLKLWSIEVANIPIQSIREELFPAPIRQ